MGGVKPNDSPMQHQPLPTRHSDGTQWRRESVTGDDRWGGCAPDVRREAGEDL